jgi:hypothetical protein
MDMAEVMVLPLPERFAAMPLARSEFERSVTHLYSRYEQQTSSEHCRTLPVETKMNT